MIQRARRLLPDLYETDETAWLEAMSELIQKGRVDELDHPHLSEYLADMAQRDRREVESRLAVLLTHLLKWNYQPKKRTRSWQNTIVVQRQELKSLLTSKVLRNHAKAALGKVYLRAVERVKVQTKLPAETFPLECPFTFEEVLSVEVTE